MTYQQTIDVVIQNGGLVKHIKHIKTGNYYAIVGSQLIKVDGRWKEGLAYINQDGQYFWRGLNDFSGFEEVRPCGL